MWPVEIEFPHWDLRHIVMVNVAIHAVIDALNLGPSGNWRI